MSTALRGRPGMRLAGVVLGTTGTIATLLLCRTWAQQRRIDALNDRLDEVSRSLEAAHEAIRTLYTLVRQRAAAGAAGMARDASFGRISMTGSFETAADLADAPQEAQVGQVVAHSVREASAPAARKAAAAPWPQADAMFEASKHAETMQYLDQLGDEGKGPEALWRRARAAHALALEAKRKGNAKDHARLLRAALADAQSAVDAAPTLSPAHKWCGICVSAASGLEGTKATIEKSFVVRDHFMAAADLDPADPTSRHLVGLWAFEVASIGWAAGKVAAALFATPPKASYDDALEHLLRAEQIQPGFYKKNQLLIAKAYAAKGDKGKAKEWLLSARDVPVANADDEEADAEVRRLLDKA